MPRKVDTPASMPAANPPAATTDTAPKDSAPQPVQPLPDAIRRLILLKALAATPGAAHSPGLVTHVLQNK